jgi:hypothetical protein
VAFRKPIPVSFYTKFAPVVKEYKSEGVYRYTAGFFPKYNSAVIALKQVKIWDTKTRLLWHCKMERGLKFRNQSK